MHSFPLLLSIVDGHILHLRTINKRAYALVNIHNFNDLVETLQEMSTFKETLTRRDRKEHGIICQKCASQLMLFLRNTIGTHLINDESGDQIIFHGIFC